MAILTPEQLLAEVTVGTDVEPEVARHPERTESAARYVRWVLVLLSLAAAALHFAYAPAHFETYWLFGVYFMAVAWFQVGWAVGMLLRPSRGLLFAGLLNGVFVGVWVLVHTGGLPVGPNSGARQPVTFGNGAVTAVELVLLAGVLVLAYRPSLARRRVRAQGLVRGLVVGLAVVLAGGVTAALAPGANGTAPQDANAAGAGGLAGAHAGHLNAFGLTGTTPCEKSGPPASTAQVTDNQGHNHRGPLPQQPIDFNTRVQLAQQQAVARHVAEEYPTVASAQAAGYTITTPYVPCIGAHYSNFRYAASFDPAHPSELLYDGSTPGAHVVGLSFLLFHPSGAPDGFAGPNDVWHQHNANGGLCIGRGAVVIGGESTSKQDCEARGGHKAALPEVWMVHDWVVPGFECSWGVFAAECPELGGRVGGTAYDPADPRQRPIPQG